MERPLDSGGGHIMPKRNVMLARGENPDFGVHKVTRREFARAVGEGVRIFPVLKGADAPAVSAKGIVETLCAIQGAEDRRNMARLYIDELRELPRASAVAGAIEAIERKFLKGEAGGKRERMETAPGQVAGRAKEGGGRSEIELRGLFM